MAVGEPGEERLACAQGGSAFLPSRDLPQLSSRAPRRHAARSGEDVAGASVEPPPSSTRLHAALDALGHALGFGRVKTIIVPPRHSLALDADAPAAAAAPAEEATPRTTPENADGTGTARTLRGAAIDDEFELRYVRNWLTALAAGARRNGRADGAEDDGDGDEEEDEALSQRAAELLAVCAGKAASGASERLYVVPLPPLGSRGSASSAAPTAARARIRDAALVRDATGSRTWGAAPLLAREALDEVLPRLGGAGARRRPRRLEVLELGAGTGLVSLALADALRQITHSSSSSSSTSPPPTKARLTLTDFHADVLANLRYNCEVNGWEEQRDGDDAVGDRAVDVRVRRLDWKAVHDSERARGATSTAEEELRDEADGEHGAVVTGEMAVGWEDPGDAAHPHASQVGPEERFDYILAADCMYEASHARWIASVARRHLARTRRARLLAVNAVRATHSAEEASVTRWLPERDAAERPPGRRGVGGGQGAAGAREDADAEGDEDEASATTSATWRLCTLTREELLGWDDFGPPALRLDGGEGGRQEDGEAASVQAGRATRFQMYHVGWCPDGRGGATTLDRSD